MSDRGTRPPPEVLATWPAPNYVNPENQTAQLMAIEITLCSVTAIVMLLRLYSRGILTKSIGSDDWLMTGALVSSIHKIIIFFSACGNICGIFVTERVVKRLTN